MNFPPANNGVALPKSTEESNLLVCMESMSSVNSRVRLLTESLGPLPVRVAHPALIIISGLPGSGKSYFARRLAEKITAVILESDALRKKLFPAPDYSQRESGLLFESIHVLAGRLLNRGFHVILDATNLSEKHRETLYHIADKTGARLIIVYLEAPEDVIGERLRQRSREAGNKSDADWAVYLKMRGSVDEIKRPHYVVNTAEDITPAIERIVNALTD